MARAHGLEGVTTERGEERGGRAALKHLGSQTRPLEGEGGVTWACGGFGVATAGPGPRQVRRWRLSGAEAASSPVLLAVSPGQQCHCFTDQQCHQSPSQQSHWCRLAASLVQFLYLQHHHLSPAPPLMSPAPPPVPLPAPSPVPHLHHAQLSSLLGENQSQEESFKEKPSKEKPSPPHCSTCAAPKTR